MNRVSLIIPSCGSHPENIQRTINSCSHICDDTVIVSTAFFIEDQSLFRDIATKVVQLDWNYVFKQGFGSMMNQGTPHTRHDWCLLLGVAETWAEDFRDTPHLLESAPNNMVFRCSHHNDPNTWKRLWNRTGGPEWSGLIHEEIRGGIDGGVTFRFQDTDKTPKTDPTKQEILRWIKVLTYHEQYWRLLNDSSLLFGTDPGWLAFVNGSRESIISFRENHQDLIQPCLSGDLVAFLKAVDVRMDKGDEAKGVNFNPTGEPMCSEV